MNAPIVNAEMLIRKPPAEVFNAIIDPAVTTKFWFTKSSGKLEPGKRVRWDWEMYGVGTDVDVKEIDPNKRILIEWDSYVGRTPVEWEFAARPDNTTMVTVSNYGFHGEDVVKQAIESMQGSRPGSNTASRSSWWRIRTPIIMPAAGKDAEHEQARVCLRDLHRGAGGQGLGSAHAWRAHAALLVAPCAVGLARGFARGIPAR
jgi:uncharacterized protein YndB with AHSA1/START domain